MAASSRAARKLVSVISSVKCLPTLRRPSTLPTRRAMRAWQRPQSLAQPRFGDRPAAADQHPAGDPDPPGDLLDLRRHGLGVAGVALEPFARARAAVAIRQGAEDDLQLVPPALTRMAEL